MATYTYTYPLPAGLDPGELQSACVAALGSDVVSHVNGSHDEGKSFAQIVMRRALTPVERRTVEGVVERHAPLDRRGQRRQDARALLTHDGPVAVLIRALVEVVREEINTLRQREGLATYSPAQVLQAIRGKVDQIVQ